jgi:hypothetical protein
LAYAECLADNLYVTACDDLLEQEDGKVKRDNQLCENSYFRPVALYLGDKIK